MSVNKEHLEELGIKDNREFTYFRLENSVIDSGLLKNVYQIALYTTLCRFANNKEYCYPSLNKLVEILGCSKPKVISTLNELLELGVIKKVTRTKNNGAVTSNLYGIVGTDINNPSEETTEEKYEKQEGLVNEINHPSKCGLLPPVNEVNYPSKRGLPNKELYKKNYIKKVVVEEKTTATNFETFKNNLLGLLPTELKSINLNTIKNIFNYSNGELELVREALIYMQINSKSMKPNVLVAILKDRDYEIKELSKNKTLSRQDKIQYMLEHLSEKEIESMKEVIRENLGVDGEHLDNHLGNLLCKKYNESEKRVS